MFIDILTIFPEVFEPFFQASILKRAQDNNKVQIQVHNLRDWATDNHRSVDDRPYGGGAGMIMRVDIIDRAINQLRLPLDKGGQAEGRGILSASNQPSASSISLQPTTYLPAGRHGNLKPKVLLLDTKGPFYTQQKAEQLASEDHLILIAPHYEGIDHRVHEHLADEVISIGPYVLTGGELPTLVVVDSIIRLLPGVINPESLKEESYQQSSSKLPPSHQLRRASKTQNSKKSFDSNLQSSIFNLEYPQYTRPAEYKGWTVPEVLLNGNHKEIEQWRQQQGK